MKTRKVKGLVQVHPVGLSRDQEQLPSNPDRKGKGEGKGKTERTKKKQTAPEVSHSFYQIVLIKLGFGIIRAGTKPR